MSTIDELVTKAFNIHFPIMKKEDMELLAANIDDGPRYRVKPKQKEFLKRLQTDRSQDVYTEQEQVCIAHCIRYDHYSNVHKDTLNNLIKKYTKDG